MKEVNKIDMKVGDLIINEKLSHLEAISNVQWDKDGNVKIQTWAASSGDSTRKILERRLFDPSAKGIDGWGEDFWGDYHIISIIEKPYSE